MLEAARRQESRHRTDQLRRWRWLRSAEPESTLRNLVLVPDRPDRIEPQSAETSAQGVRPHERALAGKCGNAYSGRRLRLKLMPFGNVLSSAIRKRCSSPFRTAAGVAQRRRAPASRSEARHTRRATHSPRRQRMDRRRLVRLATATRRSFLGLPPVLVRSPTSSATPPNSIPMTQSNLECPTARIPRSVASPTDSR